MELTYVVPFYLVPHTDLDTHNPFVQNQIADYLQSLLDLGVAGFRVDAGKHIPAEDLAAIFNKTTIGDGLVYFENSGGLGVMQAVNNSDYFPLGSVQEFKVWLPVVSIRVISSMPVCAQHPRCKMVPYNPPQFADTIDKGFKGGNLSVLQQIGSYGNASVDQWVPSNVANVFVTNHDGLMHGDQREGRVTYLDNNLYNLANAFMLAYPYGQPVVMSR